MTEIDIEPWEPEETVGKLWHRWASRLDAPSAHEGARVDLAQVGPAEGGQGQVHLVEGDRPQPGVTEHRPDQ